MPRADAFRLQLTAQDFDKPGYDARQIVRIADRLGKAQFAARHFGQDQRLQRLVGAPERVIQPQQHVAAEA